MTLEEALEKIKELELKVQQRDTYLESVKSIKDKYNSLREFMMKKGLDPDTNPEEGWTSIIGQKEEAKKTLESKLEELTNKFNNLNKMYEDEKREKTNFEIKGKLKNKLEDIIGAEDLIELLVLQNKAKIKDDNLFFKKSEAEEIPFDDFLNDYRTKNPERVRVSKQQDPAKKTEFKQNKNEPSSKSIKYEDYLKLSDDEKQKAIAENIEIINE